MALKSSTLIASLYDAMPYRIHLRRISICLYSPALPLKLCVFFRGLIVWKRIAFPLAFLLFLSFFKYYIKSLYHPLLPLILFLSFLCFSCLMLKRKGIKLFSSSFFFLAHCSASSVINVALIVHKNIYFHWWYQRATFVIIYSKFNGFIQKFVFISNGGACYPNMFEQISLICFIQYSVLFILLWK